MNDYLVANPNVAVAIAVVGMVLVAIVFVKVMQTVGMEKIRGYVYKLFVMAEHEFKYGENEEKFEYVICFARSALPTPFDMFITESLLRKVVQAWFDICKDLLDDGRFNGSGKEEGEEA